MVRTNGRFVNFAHRGASGYCPENTMVAFEKGIQLGSNGIETDVQMTKDGKLVLIHDETLKRTTGCKSYVKDMTWDEIKRLDAGRWFHSDYAGARIPLLEELLEYVRDQAGIIINLELKNGVVDYPGMESQVIERVRRYQLSEQVILSSFEHDSLVVCKEIAPEIKTGILYRKRLREPCVYAQKLGAGSLHPSKRLVTKKRADEARQQQIGYIPYTVDSVKELRKLVDMGVSGIITNYPDRLAHIVRGDIGG